MSLPLKPKSPLNTIILFCASVIYGFLLSSMISSENPFFINDKPTIISILLLSILMLIFTVYIFFRPKSLPVLAVTLFTGLSIGSGIFTVFFLIHLLA